MLKNAKFWVRFKSISYLLHFSDVPKAKQWKIGVKQDIMVDCAQAGTGELILREDRPGEVELSKSKSRSEDENLHIFHVKPLAVGTHNLKLLYGGVEIPNGAINFEVVTFKGPVQ
jgi:hypothetical protein